LLLLLSAVSTAACAPTDDVPPEPTEPTGTAASAEGISVFDHGGATLDHVRIHTLHYNDTVPAAGHVAEQFAATLVASNPLDPSAYASIFEWYSTGNAPTYQHFFPTMGTVAVGSGGPRGNPDLGFNLVDADNFVHVAIDDGWIPRPDPQFDEFVQIVLPADFHIQCTSCGALHSSTVYGDQIVYYSVMGTSSMDPTIISQYASHEFAEAVTDPLAGTWYGWTPFDDEIADRCPHMIPSDPWCTVGGLKLSALWSASQHKCVCSEFPPPNRRPDTDGEKCPDKTNYWCAAQNTCVINASACCSNTEEGCGEPVTTSADAGAAPSHPNLCQPGMCGDIDAYSHCGTVCAAGSTCGADHYCHTACQAAGAQCGFLSDGTNCGTCRTGYVCLENQCDACSDCGGGPAPGPAI
jgi:hypothetical protein